MRNLVEEERQAKRRKKLTILIIILVVIGIVCGVFGATVYKVKHPAEEETIEESVDTEEETVYGDSETTAEEDIDDETLADILNNSADDTEGKTEEEAGTDNASDLVVGSDGIDVDNFIVSIENFNDEIASLTTSADVLQEEVTAYIAENEYWDMTGIYYAGQYMTASDCITVYFDIVDEDGIYVENEIMLLAIWYPGSETWNFDIDWNE